MISNAQSEALYNYARELRQCDVLVDPMASDNWAQCLEEIPADELPKVQLEHEYFAKKSDKAPILVRVPLKHFDVLDTLAGLAAEQATGPSRQTRSICGFVQSDLAQKDLARRLEANLSLRVGTQKVYFRYFDPRVMHHLPALLAPNALDWRGVSSWGYFNWEGEWSVRPMPQQGTGRQRCTLLRLTEEQWRPFAAIEHFNATVAAFLAAGLPCPCSETERLCRTVGATLALGIAEPEDVATYLLRSRQLGFPIAQHPRWSDAQKLLRKGVPLADALNAVELRPPDNPH
jgi:hypothetical protein